MLGFLFHSALKYIYNNYFILSFSLWIVLITHFSDNVILKKCTIGFILLALLNLLFIQKITELNTYTFILGSFIYCTLFLTESFKRLKKDDLDFFMSDHFLLLFAPVLFFVGFSFMFGFSSTSVKDTLVFANIDLYTFISYLVNVTFYTILNIYCIRRFKSSKGWLKK